MKIIMMLGMLIMMFMVTVVRCQFDFEEEEYRGLLIGSLSSYHHQVEYHYFHEVANIIVVILSGIW